MEIPEQNKSTGGHGGVGSEEGPRFPGAPRARGGRVDQNRKLSKKWKGKEGLPRKHFRNWGWVGEPPDGSLAMPT